MYITNVTKDYDKITSIIYTDYDNVTSSTDNMTFSNCTFYEKDIDLNIPTLFFTIPCGLSFLCLISLMVCTLFKFLFNKNSICKYMFIST